VSVVVRFAPSPTGRLHLGGVRTALFNWLFGRQARDVDGTGGTVLLRIEDTDAARSDEVFAEDIIDVLRWLGLDWDGPVIRQSERQAIYREHLARLEREGKVYRCTCPAAQLEKAREKARAAGRHWRYPRTCRDRAPDAAADAPHVLRLRVPDADAPAMMDRIVGRINVGGPDLDDFVLTRSDGSPLYNFCCVVDDHLLGVTHVIRGADHVDNTRKQALLYDTLGFERPETAHLPLVSGLSKRLGSDSVASFRDRGFLPEAVLNYVARLGWSHGDQEVFDVPELLRVFRLEDVGHSSARVNEDKLLWLNEQHIHQADGRRLAELMRPWIGPVPDGLEGRIAPAAEVYRSRCKTLIQLAEEVRVCLVPDDALDLGHPDASRLLRAELRPILARLADALELVTPFERHRVKQAMWEILAAAGSGFRQIAPTCRLALTGRPEGPRVLDLMVVLGAASAAARLRRAAEERGR
jgi:glutamyl-tRNA synthetase